MCKYEPTMWKAQCKYLYDLYKQKQMKKFKNKERHIIYYVFPLNLKCYEYLSGFRDIQNIQNQTTTFMLFHENQWKLNPEIFLKEKIG